MGYIYHICTIDICTIYDVYTICIYICRYHFPNVSQIFYSFHSQRNFEHIYMALGYMHPCLHILVLLCILVRFIWLYLYITKWFISPLAHSSLHVWLFAQEYVSFVIQSCVLFITAQVRQILTFQLNTTFTGNCVLFEWKSNTFKWQHLWWFTWLKR